MNLVDSWGWLEYSSDGPNADFFASPKLKTDRLIAPTICAYEVFKKIIIERSEDLAFQAVSVMKQGIVVDLDTGLALSASRISL